MDHALFPHPRELELFLQDPDPEEWLRIQGMVADFTAQALVPKLTHTNLSLFGHFVDIAMQGVAWAHYDLHKLDQDLERKHAANKGIARGLVMGMFATRRLQDLATELGCPLPPISIFNLYEQWFGPTGLAQISEELGYSPRGARVYAASQIAIHLNGLGLLATEIVPK